MLHTENVPAAVEFQKLAANFLPVDARPVLSRSATEQSTTSSRKSPATMLAPTESKSKSTRKHLQSIASRWSSFGSKGRPEEAPRRATDPQTGSGSTLPQTHRAGSVVSLSSTRSAPMALPRSTPSPAQIVPPGASMVNLDYFPIGNEFGDSQTRTSSSTMLPPKKQALTPSTAVDHNPGWDQLIDGFDPSTGTIYQDMSNSGHPLYQVPSNEQWTPDEWNLSGVDLVSRAPVPQSLLSFSEESLTSGDDFLFSTAGSHNGSTGPTDSLELPEAYRGITIPVDDEFDFHE